MSTLGAQAPRPMPSSSKARDMLVENRRFTSSCKVRKSRNGSYRIIVMSVFPPLFLVKNPQHPNVLAERGVIIKVECPIVKYEDQATNRRKRGHKEGQFIIERGR